MQFVYMASDKDGVWMPFACDKDNLFILRKLY